MDGDDVIKSLPNCSGRWALLPTSDAPEYLSIAYVQLWPLGPHPAGNETRDWGLTNDGQRTETVDSGIFFVKMWMKIGSSDELHQVSGILNEQDSSWYHPLRHTTVESCAEQTHYTMVKNKLRPAGQIWTKPSKCQTCSDAQWFKTTQPVGFQMFCGTQQVLNVTHHIQYGGNRFMKNVPCFIQQSYKCCWNHSFQRGCYQNWKTWKTRDFSKPIKLVLGQPENWFFGFAFCQEHL